MALETYHRKRDFAAAVGGRDGRPSPRQPVRRAAARRPAAALRFPPRARRGAEELGGDARPEPRTLRETARRAGRGSSARLRRLRGHHPKGQYGGGEVIVWDRGRWKPKDDPEEGLRKGHLEFDLKGRKLRGRWHLVRMAARRREKGDDWLLIKGADAYARSDADPDILTEAPDSVKSGRTLAELADEPAARPAAWPPSPPRDARQPPSRRSSRPSSPR